MMILQFTPLRDKLMKLIISNPVPNRKLNMADFYVMLSITLFFDKYKSSVLNELYYKGLIQLHGDVNLFIRAKKWSDIKHLYITASVTTKGRDYYQTKFENTTPVDQFNITLQEDKSSDLQLLR